MSDAVPICLDLRWYFACAESSAGAIKSQHGSFVAMAQIGPRSMPAPVDAERALGRRFDQIDGAPSEVERARVIRGALARLPGAQVETLARAYGPHDLQELVGRAYPGDFAARDRFLVAFGEYAGIVADDAQARHFARPSGARAAAIVDAGAILDQARAELAAALEAFKLARAAARDDLAAYSLAGQARARTAADAVASW